MNTNSLWSLRLGFSNKQAQSIEKLELHQFLTQSFEASFEKKTPDFLNESPKTIVEMRDLRKKLKETSPEALKEYLKKEGRISQEMKAWWIEKMMEEEFPLREKMTCFWHNHFVATIQKVKVNYWVYQLNQILRENAFGNFKEITKKAVKSNAMVRYLDNVDNRKDKINENLSRELLELFTLGIGNYTEADIKNGAKALAGLGLGENGAQYRKLFEDNDTITFLGKTGKFKADDIIDIIFEQKNIRYLLTRKIIQWFLYDNPSEELVQYYGDYFRKVDFEIKPLLTKIFEEEHKKGNTGTKIKNPLEYSLQLITELDIAIPNKIVLARFLKEQSMDLFNQPNVKGWTGGKSWLTSQIYLQRNNIADLLCSGKPFLPNLDTNRLQNRNNNTTIKLHWTKGNNTQIISELSERLLFKVDEATQKDFEKIIKYDFDENAVNANQVVLRLFNEMVKLPEFQLI